ncbi:hypothetical protein Vretimale_397 [Volvox reticuliferus]|uniref:RNA helicase n=1 Tax=Volvox reticuliferus TaxID=1737510 RepID=A0A8J4D2M7_9CHLO|nr:hypothetical protein Vretifemale_8114 [Volvox reticuliferus]GIL94063.1 hypothetical protein Vretimale_397 [Volvox reticuliferus]
MPYVPPHLRGKQQDAASPSEPSSTAVRAPEGPSGFPRTGSYGNRLDNVSYGIRGEGGFLRQGSSGLQRSGSTQSFGDGGRGYHRGGPIVDAVFANWQPTNRVLALSDETVQEIQLRLKVSVDVTEGEPKAAPPIESFQEMNLHPNILADIIHHKYETPTPIQAQGLPIALSGRDILGCAETGSGKTASFSIPMIQHCLNQPPLRPGDGPMALVLAPTRELAQQIEREVRAFSRSSSRSVRTSIVVGGVPMHEQRHDLRNGVEIVVATPGRFIDHLQQFNTNLSRVSYIVLDEADRMLDMGFEPQIKEVMNNLPPRHQTLLFSATMPKEIEELARAYLNKPVTVKIGAVSTPTANVAQRLEHAPEGQKMDILVALISSEVAAEADGGPPMPLTIVFVERKTRCDEVASALREDGIPANALHGGLGQMEREAALRDFAKGLIKVLVATDVASRGLDIKGIGHVINMDLPKTFEDYVHRIGRTGRAGTKGRATSLWNDRDSFLVTQIKQALAELEKGNGFAFATGKEARKEERQLAREFKSQLKMTSQGMLQTGAGAVKVDDKYAHMATAAPATAGSGVADAAWDD